jgi:dTDP-4-dehydrorhamnose 3,5-epimerase
MDVRELSVPGSWVFTPRQFPDDRGTFLEAFKGGVFAQTVGHELTVAQVNTSISRAGTVRGVHFAAVPPGQAKYVFCTRGAVLDVAIDIRVGSPTFGAVDSVVLDDRDRRAIYLSEGLGHAFCALQDDATVTYLCSTPYNPTAEHGVTPVDPALALPWPDGLDLLLSPKDTEAPTLAEAADLGLLPTWQACQQRLAQLRAGG